MQAALGMFSQSENDILLVNYNHVENDDVITVRCIDKLVSSAEWLSAEKLDFSTFETWCAIAGAKVEIGTNYRNDFPCDLVITIAKSRPTQAQAATHLGDLTQVRLQELDSILAQAITEWTSLMQRDRSLFDNLAVEAERKRISEEINKLILPHLDRITELAEQSKEDLLIQDVRERMQVIAAGVSAVMSELHPRLLAQAGLFTSIRTLVDRFRRASLVETTIISNPACNQVDISLDAKFAIYRVTQEALNNIEKHSHATHALVVVKQIADELIVCIEDNGKGFQGSSSTLSRGLKNIRERARDIGARVAWEPSSSFETGTLVTISLRCC
jgi:signal transduction histidine kinase